MIILTKKNDDIIIKPNDTYFCCSICNKKFSSKYTLTRHINNICKIKKEDIVKLLLEKEKDKENKEKINQLEKKMIKIRNKIKN